MMQAPPNTRFVSPGAKDVMKAMQRRKQVQFAPDPQTLLTRAEHHDHVQPNPTADDDISDVCVFVCIYMRVSLCLFVCVLCVATKPYLSLHFYIAVFFLVTVHFSQV